MAAMKSGDFTRETTLNFSGVNYDIEFSVEDDVLTVHVENCKTREEWIGKYDASCK